MQRSQLQQVLQDLDLLGNQHSPIKIQACVESLAKELDMMETGIILWNDFNMKMVDIMINSVDIVEKYSSVEQNSGADASGLAPWACPACTFINDDPLANVCAMCGSPKPALPAVTLKHPVEVRLGNQI